MSGLVPWFRRALETPKGFYLLVLVAIVGTTVGGAVLLLWPWGLEQLGVAFAYLAGSWTLPRWAVLVALLALLMLAAPWTLRIIRREPRWRRYREDRIGELAWTWEWMSDSTKARPKACGLRPHCTWCLRELELYDQVVRGHGEVPSEAVAICAECNESYFPGHRRDWTHQEVAREVERRVRTGQYRPRRLRPHTKPAAGT